MGGTVCVVGSMKELLASFPRSPSPSLKHICLLFSVTHPFPLVLSHPLTPVKETFAWSELRMFTRVTGATIFQQLSRDCALWLPVILFLAMVYSPRTNVVTTAETAPSCTRHFRRLQLSHGCVH